MLARLQRGLDATCHKKKSPSLRVGKGFSGKEKKPSGSLEDRLHECLQAVLLEVSLWFSNVWKARTLDPLRQSTKFKASERVACAQTDDVLIRGVGSSGNSLVAVVLTIRNTAIEVIVQLVAKSEEVRDLQETGHCELP